MTTTHPSMFSGDPHPRDRHHCPDCGATFLHPVVNVMGSDSFEAHAHITPGTTITEYSCPVCGYLYACEEIVP